MTPRGRDQLVGRAVFVSASIPDAERWDGSFDALEVTDAVVALAREVLARGGRLVTAAHPTIAPLLLYVAAEYPARGPEQVTVYQSAIFDSVLPAATRRFRDSGVGQLIRTNGVENEPPNPEQAPKSLAHMRQQMLSAESLVAALFVGGMSGIVDEYRLFKALYPDAPTYAVGNPGGEASSLVDYSPIEVRDELRRGNLYPKLARDVFDDLEGRLALLGQTNSDEGVVWDRIAEHAGSEFYTIRGLPFSYFVDGSAIRIFRGGFEPGRKLARQDVQLALGRMPAERPIDLTGLREPSYMWAILMDPRIRGGAW